MLTLALLAPLFLQEAGDLFAYERWDNGTGQLPVGKEWFLGGAASPGDIDGDGVDDLAVWVSDGPPDYDFCSVMLFLNADDTVKSTATLALPGSVTQVGGTNMQFFPPFAIGDVDGNGVGDLGSIAVQGMNVIRLSATGAVLAIDTYGALLDWVSQADVAGDVDGDGVDDLVTSAGTILFLDSAGTITAEVEIVPSASGTASGAGLGDLDGDGVPDVAIGGFNSVVYVHLLNADGTARETTQLFTNVGFSGISVDAFDLNGDGRKELSARDTTALATHAVITFFLNEDGSAAQSGRIDVPGDLPWGVFWGNRIAYHSDGRLLASGDSWLDWMTLIPEVVFAAASERNGGANVASFTCAAPVLGGTLIASVDTAATGHQQALIIGFDSPFEFTLGGGQTLLCLDLLGSGELLNTGFWPGPVAQIPIAVPYQLDLIGFTMCTQAVAAFGAVPFALSNACDWVIGF